MLPAADAAAGLMSSRMVVVASPPKHRPIHSSPISILSDTRLLMLVAYTRWKGAARLASLPSGASMRGGVSLDDADAVGYAVAE